MLVDIYSKPFAVSIIVVYVNISFRNWFCAYQTFNQLDRLGVVQFVMANLKIISFLYKYNVNYVVFIVDQ